MINLESPEARDWLRNYAGSCDSTALLMAFRDGYNLAVERAKEEKQEMSKMLSNQQRIIADLRKAAYGRDR